MKVIKFSLMAFVAMQARLILVEYAVMKRNTIPRANAALQNKSIKGAYVVTYAKSMIMANVEILAALIK